MADNYLYLEQHWLEVPYYQNKRRVRVLLPANYYEHPDKNYPVLYMHDGQNVFHSKEAFAGYSWKIIPLIKQHPDLPQVIVVGIDNAEANRLDEYTPWPINDHHFKNLGGHGFAYSDWVVNTVKPFIDQTYRTRSDCQSTLLAGSSLGGLITAFMGSAYPDIFGNLGVFSSAAWLCQDAFNDFVIKHPLRPQTRVYIQTGANENDAGDDDFINPNLQAQKYIDESISYSRLLLQNGHPLTNLSLNIFADESHNEYYWAKHFPNFLKFAFKHA